MKAYLAVKQEMKNLGEIRQLVVSFLQKSFKAKIYYILRARTSSDCHIRGGAMQTRWKAKEISALICRVNRNYIELIVETH